ncbi:hypothetical protein MUK42_00616 [Musa troglodytarum]|uniref:Uncharacterized protein n=1 Tax=Musa troglodytarum TaxID=320322 RepID=A0A9E7JTM5_9LILI|nr:hypothetical protein MUK42_00616 [Musa troglodytarum]
MNSTGATRGRGGGLWEGLYCVLMRRNSVRVRHLRCRRRLRRRKGPIRPPFLVLSLWFGSTTIFQYWGKGSRSDMLSGNSFLPLSSTSASENFFEPRGILLAAKNGLKAEEAG